MSERETKGNGEQQKPAAKSPGKEAARAPLPKRFYREASVTPAGGDFAVVLDNRVVKTPKKRALAVSSRVLAEAIAAEWAAQRDVIDPAAMPLTRITNSAIDAVADHGGEVAADIAAFAASDLLCYRAETPAELVARQSAAWDPIVAWAERVLAIRLVLGEGVMPVEQPSELSGGVLRLIADSGPLRLACLHVVTTLTGSALLALAHDAGRLSRDEAWAAAHVDEDWQIEMWGADAEAAARRAFRLSEFEAASRMLEMLRG